MPAKKDSIEVEKTDATQTEHWWSSLDPKHMIALEVDGEVTYVRFSNYSLVLDLDDEREKQVSKGLHGCGREGRDIFVLGTAYKGHEHGDQVQMMKRLRELAQGHDGLNKIKGMFTWKELVENGVNPTTNDVDEVIALALRSKRLISQLS